MKLRTVTLLVAASAASFATISAFGQGNSIYHAGKSAKPSRSVASSPATGPVSAAPPDPQSQAERNAAFAPAYAFARQARSLYEAGDLSEAAAACSNAMSAAPVIEGRRQHVPFVATLLGQIYLRSGQNEKAVQWLQSARRNTVSTGLDLDLALAYARLGDYEHASQFYSDQATLRYHIGGKGVLPQDLPGTASPSRLEASILLARGLNAYFEARHDDALADFQSATQLAPDNALIAYHCADLLRKKGRVAEAIPLYKRAASTGRGAIAEEASRYLPAAQSAPGSSNAIQH